jgi:hypothetical protein
LLHFCHTHSYKSLILNLGHLLSQFKHVTPQTKQNVYPYKLLLLIFLEIHSVMSPSWYLISIGSKPSLIFSPTSSGSSQNDDPFHLVPWARNIRSILHSTPLLTRHIQSMSKSHRSHFLNAYYISKVFQHLCH